MEYCWSSVDMRKYCAAGTRGFASMRPPKRSQAGEEWLRCSPQDGEDAPIVFPPPKLRPIPPSRTCGVDADFVGSTEIVIRQEFVDQRAGFAQSGRHVLNCAKEDESNGSSETYGHLARLISGRISRNQMKWQQHSSTVCASFTTMNRTNQCPQSATKQCCTGEKPQAMIRTTALRVVARSEDEGCGCGVRTVEALRCPADALLSHKRPNQSRGQRR